MHTERLTADVNPQQLLGLLASGDYLGRFSRKV